MGESKLMMNTKGNVIQAYYSIKTVKVRINSEERADVPSFYDKLEIKIDRPTDKLNLNTFLDGLKTMLVTCYEEELNKLKLNELITIDLSLLFFNESVIGSLMNLIISAFTDCLFDRLQIDPSKGRALLAFTIKGFYIKEKDGMLWLFDPNKTELTHGQDILDSCLYSCIVDIQTGKIKLIKDSGCSISFGDTINLTDLIKNSNFTNSFKEMNEFYSNRNKRSFTLFN